MNRHQFITAILCAPFISARQKLHPPTPKVLTVKVVVANQKAFLETFKSVAQSSTESLLCALDGLHARPTQ